MSSPVPMETKDASDVKKEEPRSAKDGWYSMNEESIDEVRKAKAWMQDANYFTRVRGSLRWTRWVVSVAGV